MYLGEEVGSNLCSAYGGREHFNVLGSMTRLACIYMKTNNRQMQPKDYLRDVGCGANKGLIISRILSSVSATDPVEPRVQNVSAMRQRMSPRRSSRACLSRISSIRNTTCAGMLDVAGISDVADMSGDGYRLPWESALRALGRLDIGPCDEESLRRLPSVWPCDGPSWRGRFTFDPKANGFVSKFGGWKALPSWCVSWKMNGLDRGWLSDC